MLAQKISRPRIVISPQEGPQTLFLSTLADVAIYGGAAGGGKTYSLLIEPLRHFHNPNFGAVVFRRTGPQIRNEGGLWDTSENVFQQLGAHPRNSILEWLFPAGWTLKFSHLEHEKNIYDWQGAQIPYIGFDELTHFTEKQFWYLFSRNRSLSGVPGYIRATCNPDVNSWVRKLVDWYIGKDGLPIKERSGIVRWFIRIDEKLEWAQAKEELFERFGRGPEIQPKSFTFIASNVYDNKILMEKDPAYIGNLLALPRVDRMRLLGGNWNVRATAGMYFQREWFEVVDSLPAKKPLRTVRYWDRAATKPNEENQDPDWTRGLKMSKYDDGTFIVCDVRSMRDTPLKVEQLVKTTAKNDGFLTVQVLEQEPGASGISEVDNYFRLLQGFQVKASKPTTDKLTRAKPASASAERGFIKVLKGAWNEDFFTEVENFSEDGEGHDDQVDTLSGAYNELNQNASILDSV